MFPNGPPCSLPKTLLICRDHNGEKVKQIEKHALSEGAEAHIQNIYDACVNLSKFISFFAFQ